MGDAADDLDRYIDKLLHYEHTYADILDTWIKRDGTMIKIVDMDKDHLQNTISMLNRNNPKSRYLPILKQELLKRK